ncbi:MAG: nickel-dependent lactate racemase [Candidatus Helarchaeota archaeon]
MTQIFKIPWAAWYSDKDFTLEFPDSWEVQLFNMKNHKEITSRTEIEHAIKNPIGTPPLNEIAEGKKNAVIVIEDISRPIYAGLITEVVIEQLNNSGIQDENITILFAVGAHRPMNRSDFIKKLGMNIVDRFNIENHCPYENLIFLGNSSRGTPIYLNKTYYNADIKISIGSVIPHPLAGFGGGAKIVLPGICGIQTLESNHQAAVRGIGIGLGFITEMRKDIEEICSKTGLDFSINVITTLKRGIASIFAGHYIDAHRKAIEVAKEVYMTKIPSNQKFDIGLFNLYPEDTELSQATKGLNIFLSTKKLFKRKSALILLTAATEGRGYHSLLAETGCRLYKNWGETILGMTVLKKYLFGIFSPNVNKADVYHFYPKETIFHKNFDNFIIELEKIYGKSPKACIFPSSIQIPVDE